MDEILQDNLFYMKSLIGKRVLIETVDRIQHNGIVYVIDPIYKTIVLVDDRIDKSIELIMKNSIRSLEIVSDDIKEEFIVNCEANDIDTSAAKERLIKWLKHMFINVRIEENHLKVDDYLIIESPYTVNDCYCDNTIVLDRIRNIINLMPADFQ